MLRHRFDVTGQIKRLSGAVHSGSPAARLGMLLKTLRPLARLFDKLLYHAINNDEFKESELPPCVMIISPPRSGSTIIYQMLARAIPCVYFSNLHFLFPNYASSYLLRKNLFGANLTGFHNYYGYTTSIRDVNEGNEIVEAMLCGNAKRELIRKRFIKFLELMGATRQRPLIFKNVRAYSQITRLHQALPEMVFLRIKRDPEDLIQSVVYAYRELGTFHPIPEGLKSLEISDSIEFAVRQFLDIEWSIEIQKEHVKSDSWLDWCYEDFCSDPWPMIENLAKNYLMMDLTCLRRDVLPELKISKRVKVSADEAKRITLLLQQYANVNLLKNLV